jgi:hypothetical protein
MAFGGANRALRGVAAMDMGRDQLVSEIVLGESSLEFSRGLVVEDVNFRLIATFRKFFMDVEPAAFDFGAGFVL